MYPPMNPLLRTPKFATEGSEEDLAQCRLIVEDELMAIEAIYPDCISSKPVANGTLLKMELSIDLGGLQSVRIVDDGTNCLLPFDESEPPAPVPPPLEVSLAHLPPLILDLLLPLDYPLRSPPTILSAYFQHSWLVTSQLAALKASFGDLWLEQRELGEGVLWRIAESIVTGSFLSSPLTLADPSLSLVTIQHPAPSILLPQLTAYHARITDASFAISTFRCAICFEDRKGSACIQLSGCEHVFCKECLRDGWGLAVKEGDISTVRCPDLECVEKTSARAKRENEERGLPPIEGEAAEEDVRRVLTEEEVTRWKWLKVRRDIARDPSIVHCPLQFCQAPVPAPKKSTSDGVEEEDDGRVAELALGWKKLRSCDSCGFSFCMICKKAWHGPITPCTSRSSSSFITEYLSLPLSSPRRMIMERSFGGKKALEKMIRQYEEDEKNRKWLESSTTRCPGCAIFCEKSHGCNHMTCVRCSCHYCYRCGSRVDPKDPYKHFSGNKANPCYGKLFDEAALDSDEIPWEGNDPWDWN